MRHLITVSLCIVGLVGCTPTTTPDPDFNPDVTLQLEADGQTGELCTDDGTCLENPCDCPSGTVDIDTATGESLFACDDESLAADCDPGAAACAVITIPDPDCVVCAWVDSFVFYSSCVPADDLYCEEIDFWGNGDVVGAGAPPPDTGGPDDNGDPTEPAPPPCEQGGTFPAGDGCNFCSCDDDGNVFCTEMACEEPGCVPGESFLADDGCNVCECLDDGTFACTEMACGGTCTRCYNGAGELVIDECGSDCRGVACPDILCAEGYKQRVLPGDCCASCVPADDCSDVACPADAAYYECPDGYRPILDDCCGVRCEPDDCSGVVCPALADLECPEGTQLVSGAPDCCPRCEPYDEYCYSDEDCAPGGVCSTSYGDCLPPADCGPGEDCIAVCTGICLPGECALDFVCDDGSLPQGPECWCPQDGDCPLDFICPDGTNPVGPECYCADECLLDFICPNGMNPQGAQCECSDYCPLDFLCQDGSQPQGAACACPEDCPDVLCADGTPASGFDCWCPDDGCPLDFICQDGSNPQGPECLCPDTCDALIACEDGSQPQGSDCRCPGDECALDFVCPDGTNPVGADCQCSNECFLEFICSDGSLPVGAACECPGNEGDVCYSDQDCFGADPAGSAALHCSVSDGECNPPPGCEPGDACPAVCTGVCVQ